MPLGNYFERRVMTNKAPLRVAVSADQVSIWSSEIFGDVEPSRLREFLSRAFAVDEVQSVELRLAKSFGRISYKASEDSAQVWRKLSSVLRSPSEIPQAAPLLGGLGGRVDAGVVYLEGRRDRDIRIARVGDFLSTWRVHRQSENTVHLWHPLLRNRRDVVFRLEEELTALLGVDRFEVSALTAGVVIRFDERTTSAERITRELEKAWPRLLAGVDEPPSRTRLAAAVGLVGLSLAGQYVAPVVRPIALGAVTLYGFPNVVSAAKQLTRGQVGVSALYSTGMAFMLLSGSPFAASVMAVLTQSWPHLTRKKMVSSQRRLFASHRRRPSWVRTVNPEGVEVALNVDGLHRDDRVVVRAGETIPVDGVVVDGIAAVRSHTALDADQLEDRSSGDPVAAGLLVRDGSLTIRVESAGERTAASYLASLLPHGGITGLPSSAEVERVADRNAKPVLALSLLNLLLTRNLRRSQGTIRPDYVTAPRLSAQLSALRAIAQGLNLGAFFREPAALDRLARANVYVFDESAGLDRRNVAVATVELVDGVSKELTIGYAVVAYRGSQGEQGRALAAAAPRGKSVHPQADSVRDFAGVTRYRDRHGRQIEIASNGYLAASKIGVPTQFRQQALRYPSDGAEGANVEVANDDPALRPLWVLRDGVVIGVVTFERSGEPIGKELLTRLRTQNQTARFLYVSRAGQVDAEALAAGLEIDAIHGNLSGVAKGELIRGLGGRALWVGDGSEPEAREALLASSVSVSVAPMPSVRQDAADVLLPRAGIRALAQVIAIGRAHSSRLEQDYRTVYAVNLLGVAGAFLARFNGLQAGLLSNFGTGLVYLRHQRALDRLASTTEKRRTQSKHSVSR